MLEEGVIPPFYLDKIRDDQGTRGVSALNMSILFYFKLTSKLTVTYLNFVEFCALVNP